MPSAPDLLNVVRGWYRGARLVAASPSGRLAVFAAFSLAASWQLLSTAPALNQFRDAHVLGHYETVARDSLLRWHEAPLWDPYYCGGMYLLGTPQARFVSPTFLFTLAFGEARGEALAAFVMMIVGLEGMYRYARARRTTGFAAFLAAPLFGLGGIYAVSPALGWISFFGFELLPWIALGVRRAVRGSLPGVLVAAFATAWCVGMGGTYAAPLAALWCLLEVTEHAVREARRRDLGRLAVGLGFALGVALLAGGLAAVRLWPIVDSLEAAPRLIGGTPGNRWIVLARMLFSGPAKDTNNGSFYLGALGVPAVLVALARPRRSLPLILGGVLCAWLAAGYAVRPSLFAGLRHLPLYATLRYPERFLVPFSMAVSALAARGVTLAEVAARRPQKTRLRLLAARAVLAITSLALVVNVAPMVTQHVLHANGRTMAAPPATEDTTPAFHQARGNRWALAYYEPMQRGSLSCWEAYPVPESPLLRGDLGKEERVLEPGSGSVTETRWTPDEIDLDVDLAQPATLAVNQNWHSGWRASRGDVMSTHGLLTVALPEGKYPLALRFRPRSATGGAWASLVALAGAAALAWRTRRARPGSAPRADALWLGIAALAPLVPIVLTGALVHERSFAEPPVTPSGEPVIADGLGEGAVRLDARFGGGMVLEAATLSSWNPSAGTDLTLELDWKRDEGADKGLGVFMHIEPSNGKGMNGDHALLSGVLDPDDAPAGKTLRDVMPLWVPGDSRGKEWKIWVGLWRLRAGGDRLHIADPGHATVDGDRVLVGTFTVK